jgi:hypothetical protein
MVSYRCKEPIFAGSWQQNTGRITIILDLLTSAGISVQLKFLEQESSRDLVRYFVFLQRGNEIPTSCVRLNRVLHDGKAIAFHQDMQHNRNHSSLTANSVSVASSVMAALGKA